MRIIPAIDIIGGKCVRLTKGDYSTQKIYSENPLDMAQMFEDAGIKYLHVVDLDGAKSKQIVNYKTLEVLASQTGLNIDFGGGIKSENDIKTAFDCGAKQITVGSSTDFKQTAFPYPLGTKSNRKQIYPAQFTE